MPKRTTWLMTLPLSERQKICSAGGKAAVESRRAKKLASEYVRFADIVNVQELNLDSEEGIRKVEDACVQFLATKNASYHDLPFVRAMLNAIDSIGSRRISVRQQDDLEMQLREAKAKLLKVEQSKRDQGEI